MSYRLLAILLIGGLATPTAAQSPSDPSQDEQTLRAARLQVTGPALLEFVRVRSRPTADAARLRTLLGQLESKDGAVRDQAFTGLVQVGMPAVALLRQAANNADDAQLANLARECLGFIDGTNAEALTIAVVRQLGRLRPDGTASALVDFASAAESENARQALDQALADLATGGGKVDPALLQALKDESPLRRALAAEAICRSGNDEQRQAVKPLLKDEKPTVRFRAALALARRHEADAIPVLIDLLGQLPKEQRTACEEYLTDLAGAWGVTAPPGDTPLTRQIRRDVWLAWWNALAGKELVEELRVRTLDKADQETVAALIKDLGKEAAADRDKASARLVGLGVKALPPLRAAADDMDARIRASVRQCIETIEKEGPPPLPPTTLRLIALRKPEGAAEAVLAFAGGADTEPVADVLQEALAALAVKDGKAHRAFLAALKDTNPARRIAAAEALAAAPEQQSAVRPLLKDADLTVRGRAALALANAAEKEAIPVLVALIGEGPVDQAHAIDQFLSRLAGDKRPDVTIGTQDAERRKARDTWQSWWDANATTITLRRQDSQIRDQGLTVVVEQYNPTNGQGRVVEFDARGKVRWEVGQLLGPYDAQVIGPDRILVAEYNASRVTERTLKGEIKWQNHGPAPIACERLRNGNTFIARRNQLLEVDPQGKEVVSVTRPGDYYMSAVRLRDGNFVAFTNNLVLVRLDRNGRELKSTRITPPAAQNARYYSVLPNGNLLVSTFASNTVLEYDGDGKKVSELPVTGAGYITRTASGNNLIAAIAQQKVVENDRSGRVVREFTENVRPFKAIRR